MDASEVVEQLNSLVAVSRQLSERHERLARNAKLFLRMMVGAFRRYDKAVWVHTTPETYAGIQEELRQWMRDENIEDELGVLDAFLFGPCDADRPAADE